ncbi:FAD-dependent monooxygenase [Pandoraea apista]|uniref:Salicylate hydroxylase n=1 Tax=Pandoraea apista TaxID=93218 RepID=A0ABX9ZKS2_9BURK|nr:FAD-dependent monooxygenase [Pandoraea apista]PTE00793.1 salicylate hydroxylase [Pandoraea apista]RRJ32769.1 salicylate hydroxylase [Pandoraea apista]RRJ73363.1 salicylate hydroxylase [Pandoraea apista]RSD08344.1 salicylate hydroxylase [Pandoraea apista]RSK77335.1 salicylate hydroxylase [Pandoraea apista]
MQAPLIGINGAGIGGLAAAIGLIRAGFRVRVYEQASQFARVGADINLTPNAVRALDGLGVGDALRKTAAQPSHRISRTWDSGEETSRLEMAQTAQTKYGAPQLTMHRADLLQALEQAVPAASIALGRKLVSFEAPEGSQTGPIRLTFADGTQDEVDVLIGADGIHSVVRTGLFGQESPEFTGVVAYRAVVPADRLKGVPNLGAFTKWWGPNPSSQIVTFPLNLGRDIFVFATTPQDSWTLESWTAPGDVHELRAMYADYHPEAQALLAACDSVLKSALYVRDPLPQWSRDRVSLLGDASHPMMPFMAQGAGMAIEDAVVLSRHLAAVGPNADAAALAAALARYEASRRERTARVQIGSRGNQWLKEGGNADWVYEYDAWQVPLAA